MAPCIRQVQSKSTTAEAILDDLRAGLDPRGLALVMIYFSPHPDAERLGRLATEAFTPATVIGCTTAGEIGPDGYSQDSVLAIGFYQPDFSISTLLLQNLTTLSGDSLYAALNNLSPEEQHQPTYRGCFALTLFDGFCLKEEVLSSAIHAVLGTKIPVCGGSAADGLRMRESDILFNGKLHRDCAVIILVRTNRRFEIFKNEHFTPMTKRMVVTGARIEQREVTEINGRPAAQEYARLIGCRREDLSFVQFARHPLMVRVGGMNFVRSIIHANQDDSLTFACAIDCGLVLHLGESEDIADSLSRCFNGVRLHIGEPEMILGFDCILRRLELEDRRLLDDIGAIMAANHVAGFSTQGEQYRGMHINQTFTGIALSRDLAS